MRHFHYIWASLLTVGFISPVFANDSTDPSEATPTEIVNPSASNPNTTAPRARLEGLKELKKELKGVTAKDLKVNANATQPESEKDPLQPLNRQIFAFNDVLDRNVARPIAVQYKEKLPSDVRGSYRLFRKNLGEPWNAVNQLAQGRPLRAVKSLGRFTVNTITTLGLADPARRMGLSSEEENFGTTLGYYGVPSGAYVVLPILGPSTLRDSFGLVVDSQARPQKYLLDDQDGLYWSEQFLRAVDTRAQILDIEDVLQGDRYAAIRDIYLQRKNFAIAEKKGLESENMFIDDLDDLDDLDNNVSDEDAEPQQ